MMHQRTDKRRRMPVIASPIVTNQSTTNALYLIGMFSDNTTRYRVPPMSSLVGTIFAASMAISRPKPPMAMPTWAALSVGGNR